MFILPVGLSRNFGDGRIQFAQGVEDRASDEQVSCPLVVGRNDIPGHLVGAGRIEAGFVIGDYQGGVLRPIT